MKGAAAGLEPVFPLGHPPFVGLWGWGALSALRCPLPQAPAPAPPVPFKQALTCWVQPSHFLFPSVVQAGTAGWAQFAPVSAPPLLTLMLPNGGPEEGKLRSQLPAPPGRGTQSQSLASRLAPEHSNLQLCPQASEKAQDEHGLSVPLRLSSSSRGSGLEVGEEGDRVSPTGSSA